MDEVEGAKGSGRSRKHSQAEGADMVRRILPKQEDENSPPLDSIFTTRATKRRCVSSACIPCRKRKSKVGFPVRTILGRILSLLVW